MFADIFQDTCQDNLFFDLFLILYNNVSVIPQSILLPIMGGMGIAPILPRMGVGYFIKQKEYSMKKTLKGLIAVTASVISTGAMASNMENPLYMPMEGEFYTKTGAAIMYKKTDHTAALIAKNADGKDEFPVWRFTEDLGYGITDRLDIHGRFGYTKDGDINRKGMHRGRMGMTFRALTEDDPFVLDLYADAYLSGAMPMKGTIKPYGSGFGFDYANYSNGRWGVIAGTKFGKTWADFTLAGHVEYLQTFGNHNNKIKIEHPVLASVFEDEISVDLKSTHEWTAGIDAFYQIDMDWSCGFGFEFVEHADNGVKSVHSGIKSGMEATAASIASKLADMNDGWDEYILKANLAYKMSDAIQWTLFGEYTFDDSHAQSQNGTDAKIELGVRLNARF